MRRSRLPASPSRWLVQRQRSAPTERRLRPDLTPRMFWLSSVEEVAEPTSGLLRRLVELTEAAVRPANIRCQDGDDLRRQRLPEPVPELLVDDCLHVGRRTGARESRKRQT